MSQLTFQIWESWMLPIQLEARDSSFDRDTAFQSVRMEFRFPSDPKTFYGFLGEQVRPCVYRPSKVFAENYLDGLNQLGHLPESATFEITNICELEEGLETEPVGYSFQLRFRWQDFKGQSF